MYAPVSKLIFYEYLCDLKTSAHLMEEIVL